MTTFRDAYKVLQQHADTLRNQTEPNIDDLLTIVNESVQAYKVCKQRIDAVEQALEQALEDSDFSEMMDASGSASGSTAQASPDADAVADDDDLDEDLPF